MEEEEDEQGFFFARDGKKRFFEYRSVFLPNFPCGAYLTLEKGIISCYVRAIECLFVTRP